MEFLPILHNLLVSVIRHEVVAHGEKLACPTDYSLCIGSLLTNGNFQQANRLTRNCAALQHTFLVTLFHDSRLRLLKASEFVPHNRSHWLGVNLDRPLSTLWEPDGEIVGEEEEEELDDIAGEIEDDLKDSEDVEESASEPSELERMPMTKTPGRSLAHCHDSCFVQKSNFV